MRILVIRQDRERYHIPARPKIEGKLNARSRDCEGSTLTPITDIARPILRANMPVVRARRERVRIRYVCVVEKVNRRVDRGAEMRVVVDLNLVCYTARLLTEVHMNVGVLSKIFPLFSGVMSDGAERWHSIYSNSE
jgi:hypothetical protein